LILVVEDDLPQTKILGIGAAISVTPISAIPIHSVAMPVKAPDEIRFTLEPSLAAACRQSLKSIVVYAPNEQDMSNIERNALTSKRTTFPPPHDAENIIDILDCVPSPTECMVIFFVCVL